MKHSIFLSYPKPINILQENFIEKLQVDLQSRGYEPRTLGVSDYDMEEPLVAIRRLMLESYGVITVAFRRTIIIEGYYKPDSVNEKPIINQWISSPYCQIEPAMAFQIGLPIMILRETGVIPEGVLEKGVIGLYLPEFDLESKSNFLDSIEWKQMFNQWNGIVSMVIKNKGYPQKLY